MDTTDTPMNPPTTAIATKAPDKISVPMGVRLDTLDQAWRFATVVAETDFAPKAYRGKPADILAAIQHGQELGLTPMQSLSSLNVVNGMVSLWGDGLLAVI